jgi:uridine kinase
VKRTELIDYLAHRIIQIQKGHPLRVAIDGPDAAGKTTLAQELISPLQARGRPVIRASIDGFHNPARIRRKLGSTSPEGYYHHSFNYRALIDGLLSPLGPGGSRQYILAVFDYRADSAVEASAVEADVNAVLLFDGVFLLRPDLIEYWDFTIFVEADFDTTVRRAERRDAALPKNTGIDRGWTRIGRISADQISENQLNPRPSAVYSPPLFSFLGKAARR